MSRHIVDTNFKFRHFFLYFVKIFYISSKIRFFDTNYNFCPNFLFHHKVDFLAQILIFVFRQKIMFFGINFIFRQKIYMSSKIRLFGTNLKFGPKFGFLTKSLENMENNMKEIVMTGS